MSTADSLLPEVETCGTYAKPGFRGIRFATKKQFENQYGIALSILHFPLSTVLRCTAAS